MIDGILSKISVQFCSHDMSGVFVLCLFRKQLVTSPLCHGQITTDGAGTTTCPLSDAVSYQLGVNNRLGVFVNVKITI